MFKLDQRLQDDTFALGQFKLSTVLLMNDARYPWVILVPRRAALSEIYQLSQQDQQQLMLESSFVSKQLMALIGADKMNVAALGNVVSQLHLHHVARFEQDQTWPGPVWGVGKAVAYTTEEQQGVCQQLEHAFSDFFCDGD